MNKKINVAVFTEYEENANNFINAVSNSDSKSVTYKDFEITFGDVWNEKLPYENISELAMRNDRLILLVDSVEGVHLKVSHMIEEIIITDKIAVIVVDNVENENADPEMAIEEIQHVLVMRKASDAQLDGPIIYVNETEKKSKFDIEDDMDSLNSLYEAIINN